MEKNNYIVAIDLGSSGVIVAVGSRAEDGKLFIEEVVERESKGISRGEVKNVELAAQSIKEAVNEMEQKLGIRITEAYTGISGSHLRCAKHPYYVYVASKDGEIFDEDVRKLNESMRNVQAPDGYKLMQIIPQHYIVNEDEEVADPVGMFGKTLGSTFNLIIGENVIISRLEKALQKVGIEIVRLFINPLAMAEAVTFPDEKEVGVAVVDIGAGTSDLCIYQDGIVRNISVIPVGADSINKDIRSYGIMERYVEDLKVMYGCAVASMVDAEKLVKVPGRTPNDFKDISFYNLATIIEARMLDIVDYVMEEIKAAGYEGKLGAGMILTGGGSNLMEIKTLFEKRSGMDVRIAAPDILVTNDSKEAVSKPEMAAVVGVLWLGMHSGTKTVVGDKQANAASYAPVAGAATGQPETDGYDPDTFYLGGKRPKKGKKKPAADTPAQPDPGRIETPRQPKKSWIDSIRKAINKAVDTDILDEEEDTSI